MSSLCDYMLQSAKQKLKKNKILPPPLRRQIAGNLENPYDLDDLGNVDIKFYMEDFLARYGTHPHIEQVESIAVFPTAENLSNVKLYLKTLSHLTGTNDMDLSKL